jgi:hypothetical protein
VVINGVSGGRRGSTGYGSAHGHGWMVGAGWEVTGDFEQFVKEEATREELTLGSLAIGSGPTSLLHVEEVERLGRWPVIVDSASAA